MNENSTKFYAACHLTHATIDAGRAIRARVAPAPETVDAVLCRVHPLVLEVAANPEPRTGLEAKFSIAYCAATPRSGGKRGNRSSARRASAIPQSRASWRV
jgi:2-methylcitrate dehydratase PrpD